MPTPSYISIEGKTQGNITAGAFTSDSVGNIFVQGHEDEMLVQEFQHVVTVPTDPPTIRSACRSACPQAVQIHRCPEQSGAADVQLSGVRRDAAESDPEVVPHLC